MNEPKQKRSLIPLMSFIGGVVITFLVMNYLQTRGKIEELREQLAQKEEQAEPPKAEEKHWMDEMIEKRTQETEQRIKDQQAEGDEFKNQFQQYTD